MLIKVYGIVYGDKTTEYTPYQDKATERRWRFENNHIIDIIDNYPLGDYLGIFSWRFSHKTGISKAQVMGIQPGYDVYNFSRKIGVPNFMNWSDEGHRGIKGFIQSCCDHCGLKYTNYPKHIIYANQFVARSDIYTDYVNTVIKPSLELLEGPLWVHVNKDAGYTRAMDKESLMRYTGLEFYNYVPFILERMMMQYVYNRNLKCLDVNHR